MFIICNMFTATLRAVALYSISPTNVHNVAVMLLACRARQIHVITLPIFFMLSFHDGVIKWKHFLRYWPLVRGIHRSPVTSPHNGQWHGVLIFSLICAWINEWVNNGDLRRYSAHYDVIVNVWLPKEQPQGIWVKLTCTRIEQNIKSKSYSVIFGIFTICFDFCRYNISHIIW